MTNIPRFKDYSYDPNNPNAAIDVASVETLPPDVALQLYIEMVRLRVMEEELIKEYHPADEMRCPVHFCVGQEAAPAVLGLKMSAADVIGSHYRSHGYYLAKGAP